jgi:hypothetical protein
MADSKISQLDPAVVLNAADLFVIVQGATNKKVTTATMFGNISTPVVVDATLDAIDNSDNVYFTLDNLNASVGVGTDAPVADFHVVGEIYLDGTSTNSVSVEATSAGTIGTTLVENDFVWVNTSSGVITYTLPAPQANKSQKKEFYISTGGNNLTVLTGNTTNNSVESVILSEVGDSVVFRSNGEAWFLVSYYSRAAVPVTIV